MKLRSFFKAKNTVIKRKWQPIALVKIFTNRTLDGGLISKTYKQLKKLVIKKSNNNWATDLNRELSTNESKMTKRHLGKCPTFLAIREMQIKTILRFHLTSVSIANIKTLMII